MRMIVARLPFSSRFGFFHSQTTSPPRVISKAIQLLEFAISVLPLGSRCTEPRVTV